MSKACNARWSAAPICFPNSFFAAHQSVAVPKGFCRLTLHRFFCSMMRSLWMAWCGICWCAAAFAFQTDAKNGAITPQQKEFNFAIKKTPTPVKVDGVLDEAVWAETKVQTGFWKKFPTDDGPGTRQTTARVTYDDRFLYIAFEAYDSGKQFITTLKRDGGHDGSDGVAVILDPMNQHTNGFFFVVNAFNSQSEDLLSAGERPNFSWDHKWFSATQRYGNKWTAEMAIPFKTLRYQPDQLMWGINFLRIDTKTNEYSVWAKLPVNFPSYDLGYAGAMHWDAPPPVPGSNIVLLPYATGQGLTNNAQGNHALTAKANAGLDAKVALSSSLNLDVTLNPDFSQIEVDQQVTNLTRFNIFLPERRTFFLENADLFATFGIEPIRPFYSRTIGLDASGNAIPIIGGARVTGNVGNSTRIGVMNMQTANKGNYNMENFTAATVNQRVLKRSVVKAYFLNRQTFMSAEEKAQNPMAAYGRNAGAEFNYSNVAGTWSAWGTYHKSFKPGITKDDTYGSIGVNYSSRKLEAVVDATSVGTNYYTDMGFVQRIDNYDAERDTTIRVGFRHIYNEVQYRMFPKGGKVNTHRVGVESYIAWNPDGSLNERNHEGSYVMQFRNTGSVYAGPVFSEVHLLYPLSFTGQKPLPAGSYSFWQGFAGFESDFRKPIAYGARVSGGQFYNGTVTSVRVNVVYRKPPHWSVALQAEYNHLQFPGNFGSTKIILISPRVDINFTTQIFWTTFFQFNTQANNFNINSRFQWRFRPMSDLYLVYTDNYFTDPLLKNKNRAMVVKFNFWINT